MKNQDEHTSADYYFDSYSHFGIHEEMLKDSVRTRTYMQSILNNKHLFQGKVVLDVGCGTGILSMFAAKAGARRVFAVDMSAIAQQAKQIIKDNGFQDVIEVLQGKMEDLELPEKVDIIISEWMGYALHYESMLPTVLGARDKWMNAGGKILPDKFQILIATIEDQDYKEEKIEFWNNVYGFNMQAIKQIALQEPLVDTVNADQINSSTFEVAYGNINTMTKDDIPFQTQFELTFTRNDHVHALVMWFDIDFDASHKRISFSTSPMAKNTHWKQTVFYFEDTLTVNRGERMTGEIICTPNKLNPRDLDFELSYEFEGSIFRSTANLTYRMR